jgi:hypothetical protein
MKYFNFILYFYIFIFCFTFFLPVKMYVTERDCQIADYIRKHLGQILQRFVYIEISLNINQQILRQKVCLVVN